MARALPAAVLPAAGASTRMGRPKLLLPWGETTVLEATIAALQGGGVETVMVVVAADGPLRDWIPPPGVRRAVNGDPSPGMLSSVLVGVRALRGDPERHGEEGRPLLPGSPAGADDGDGDPLRSAPDPLLVCPADLPALRPATVAALLAAYRREGGIVVPRHGRRRGHPLLIAPSWQARIPQLAAHEGGLRRILELAAGAVHEVEVDDPGSVRDVDTPADYDALRP
jgi:CTP:molybdopterin cytidylyltransferase MocA